jgi:hypothetical protein
MPPVSQRVAGLGYTDICIMSYGITGWIKDGKPVVQADRLNNWRPRSLNGSSLTGSRRRMGRACPPAW